MTDVRVGVIGGGAIAQIAHLPVIKQLTGVELVAIADNDLPKARALAARFEIPSAFDDIEELLKYSTPDAVAVCTPNHLHEVHAVTALSAGVHVLCERPLALSYEGCNRIIETSRKTGKVAMVGLNHRYRNDVQVIRGFLGSGELGSIHTIRAGWHQFRPSRASLGWRKRRAQSGGGAMLDLGTSVIDLAMWLAGCPQLKRVTGHLVPDQDLPEVEQSGSAMLSCAGGLSIFVDVSWHYLGGLEKFWFEIVGDKGAATIGPLSVFKEMHGTPVNVTPTGAREGENPFTASYRAEWASFIAAVRGDVAAPPLDDQLTLHKVVQAIYLSAREDREVTV